MKSVSKQLTAPDFTMASENKATDPSPSQAEDPLNVEEPLQANVVNRVTSIPLIHSAFNLVSSAYNFTKGTHPYVTTVCTVAETVAAVAVGSAVGGAQPILSHLEPQIAKVNEYACKSLDQLEEKLPFLQQPTEKVLTDTKQLVANTVMNAVDTAKDAVASRVAGAVDLTKHVVQDSVELTKSVVSSTVNTALDAASGTKDVVTSKVNAAVGQGREAIQDSVEMTSFMVNSGINTAKAVSNVVASGVDAMLWKSEELVDHYLPMTEEELVQLAASVEGSSVASVEQQKQQQSYFVRLGSLSNKVRHRAYLHSLNKLQLVKKNTQDTLSYLQRAINLVESVKEGAGQKLQEGQEKLYELWLEWTLTQPKGAQVEPRVLAMLRMITLRLQPAYMNLMSSIQGLPSSIQETMQQALSNVQQLQASFSSACSFQDLSASILSQNQDRVVKLRESLDALLDYVANGVPLNWLVGPFSPLFQATKASHDVRMTERESLTPEEGTPEAPAKQVTEAPKTLEKQVTETPQTLETQVTEAPKTLEKQVTETPKAQEKQGTKASKAQETSEAPKSSEKGASEAPAKGVDKSPEKQKEAAKVTKKAPKAQKMEAVGEAVEEVRASVPKEDP
ncbi:PREDICTED: perilipin-3-like isoform X2 [Gavialis gangeticus]|uniref:perilipin-3-like isoform X2 n=1 Tax=Gavialis gangeticus TaxID=94835 RepID=UPI00092F9A73|nr:PREDICTED: perilipin-3-like isoform X2 [Gavialis gangeticus]